MESQQKYPLTAEKGGGLRRSNSMQNPVHKTDKLDRRMVYGSVRFPEYWGKSKRKAKNVVKVDSGVTVEMLRAQGIRGETGAFGVFTEPFDA